MNPKPTKVNSMNIDTANPIVQKILELTDGEYDFDETDIAEINRAENPELVAKWLFDRITDFANDIATDPELEEPFDPQLIPTDMLIRAVDLSRAIAGYAGGSAYLWKRLGRKNMMKLFRIIAENTPEQDRVEFEVWLQATYNLVLGREWDDEGREFYIAAREAGVRLSVIVESLELSDEALGRMVHG